MPIMPTSAVAAVMIAPMGFAEMTLFHNACAAVARVIFPVSTPIIICPVESVATKLALLNAASVYISVNAVKAEDVCLNAVCSEVNTLRTLFNVLKVEKV